MSAIAARHVDLPAQEVGLDDLREMMRAVTETTERLQQTHQVLRHEVARLQGELAEANVRLRRSESLAALGEMAAGIAHEVRNPLGSIRLYLQMLVEDLADRPEQRDVCVKIDQAVTGLDAIVRDVLAFARETQLSVSAVHAGEIVERSVAGCEALRRAAGVRVERPVTEDVPLEADAGLMAQALGNVVRNAIEAMAESESRPRVLTVDVTRRSERCPDGRRASRVVFAVQDTGPGIAPEVVQRMFNPFFTTRRTGTGLGLAIVHRIVDAHGGHVNVHMVPGGGARVELCVPPRPETGPSDAVRTDGTTKHAAAGTDAADHPNSESA